MSGSSGSTAAGALGCLCPSDALDVTAGGMLAGAGVVDVAGSFFGSDSVPTSIARSLPSRMRPAALCAAAKRIISPPGSELIRLQNPYH